MNEPGFEIPGGKVATNCGSNGTHFRNLWLILDDAVIPHRDKYTFKAVMECVRSAGPDYLLFARDRTKVTSRDELIIEDYVDDVTDYHFDSLIEYPEYEHGKPCFREFGVTVENLSYLPFVSSYCFMAISGGNTSWYQLPLVFELKP